MTTRSLTPPMFTGSRPLGTFHNSTAAPTPAALDAGVYGQNTRVSAPLGGFKQNNSAPMYNQAAASYVTAHQQLQQQQRSSVSLGGTSVSTSQPLKDVIAPSSQPSQLYGSYELGRGASGQLGSGGAYGAPQPTNYAEMSGRASYAPPAVNGYIPTADPSKGYSAVPSTITTMPPLSLHPQPPMTATGMQLQPQLHLQQHLQRQQQADAARLAQLSAEEEQLATEEHNYRSKLQELASMKMALLSESIASNELITTLAESQRRLQIEPVPDRSVDIANGEDRVIEARARHEEMRRTLEQCQAEMDTLSYVAEYKQKQKERLLRVKESFSRLEHRRREVRDTNERLVEIETERHRVISRHCAELEPMVLKFAPSMALHPVPLAASRTSGRYAVDLSTNQRESQQPKRTRIEIPEESESAYESDGFNKTYPPRGSSRIGDSSGVPAASSNRGTSYSSMSARTTTAHRPPTVALSLPRAQPRPSATGRYFSKNGESNIARDKDEDEDEDNCDFEQSMQFSCVDVQATRQRVVTPHPTSVPARGFNGGLQSSGNYYSNGGTMQYEGDETSFLIPADEGDSMAFSLVH